MTPSTLGLIIFSVTLSALAQICLKIGMSSLSVQKAISSSSVSATAYAVLSSPAVIGGLALYGLGAIVWLSVLARIDVSIAYPFVGISFLITAALAVLILGEPLSTPMIIGTSLVILGVAILARG
jgi:multidrug transporter EmrE-like cation transporter